MACFGSYGVARAGLWRSRAGGALLLWLAVAGCRTEPSASEVASPGVSPSPAGGAAGAGGGAAGTAALAGGGALPLAGGAPSSGEPGVAGGPLAVAGANAVGGAGESQQSGGGDGPYAAAGEGGFASDPLQEPMGLGLLGAPLVFNPTEQGFSVSVVLAGGEPEQLRVRLRAAGAVEWGDPQSPEVPAADLARFAFDSLSPGTTYEYELLSLEAEDESPLFQGTAVTARESGASFSFALITDTHIGGSPDFDNQGDPAILSAVTEQIEAAAPDFVANLGDMLDFHQYGFNRPPPTGAVTRAAYLQYRQLLGATVGKSAHFGVIGNWEGENGNFGADAIGWSRAERMLYLPGPNDTTYPEGGSPAEDYYAFRWGDALFITLNVMSYTPTEHLLDTNGGTPEDWTLGQAQFDWLTQTLQNATSKWRFILIHHAVGGAAGNPANAAYGRGGGQAAYVGEQALVHQMMIDYGVQIFFYGHDHVFTDMVVDDIHYTMPGSAGAIWMFGPADTGYTQSWLESGWANVDVSPESVDVQFIGLSGELIYDYTLE